MDYDQWGMEYLLEAKKLREYLKPLRKQMKNAAGMDAILLHRRVSMLGEMGLELYHTGKYLMERREKNEAGV